VNSRQTARDALATELVTALGASVKTVTASKLSDIKGMAPIVYIANVGSKRERITLGSIIPTFYFNLIVYVPREGWTDAEAVDALDTIESKIATLMQTLVESTNVLNYSAASSVTEIEMQSRLYYRESIPVAYTYCEE